MSELDEFRRDKDDFFREDPRAPHGAGRYLEVEPPVDGRVVVDFNDAYNPYCCYNEAWSCPIPPGENWLPVPIRAGEKDFTG